MSELHPFEAAEQMPGLEAITDPRLYEITQVALQVDNPLQRGMLLGSVAGHLCNQPGFEAAKEAALQAHTESLEPRWNDGWQEFTPETVYEHIAKRTKDVAVLQQLKPNHSVGKALALIALETGDESIVPSNEYDGRDTYYKMRALRTGNIADTAHIESPFTRVMTYHALIRQLLATGQETKAAEIFEIAWQDIPNEPDKSDQAQLYVIMADSFPSAERIADPIIRICAYGELYYSIWKDGQEALDEYRTQSSAAIVRTIEESKTELNPEALSSAVFKVFQHTKDTALLPYITSENERAAAERDIMFQTVRDLGSGVHISTAPFSHQQGTHMHEITSAMRNEDEARTIENPWWRNQALAYVSAHLEDGEQKTRIQDEVTGEAITRPRGDGYTQSSDLVSFVQWMDDVRVAWRLLDDPRVTCYTIAELAKHFNDENLALQIADDRPDCIRNDHPSTAGMFRRDRALSDIAHEKGDVTIARHIRHPQVRAEALLYVYEKELGTAEDPA